MFENITTEIYEAFSFLFGWNVYFALRLPKFWYRLCLPAIIKSNIHCRLYSSRWYIHTHVYVCILHLVQQLMPFGQLFHVKAHLWTFSCLLRKLYAKVQVHGKYMERHFNRYKENFVILEKINYNKVVHVYDIRLS